MANTRNVLVVLDMFTRLPGAEFVSFTSAEPVLKALGNI